MILTRRVDVTHAKAKVTVFSFVESKKRSQMYLPTENQTNRIDAGNAFERNVFVYRSLVVGPTQRLPVKQPQANIMPNRINRNNCIGKNDHDVTIDH